MLELWRIKINWSFSEPLRMYFVYKEKQKSLKLYST